MSSSVCAVCGDRATRLRYSHYRVTSCFSCRAFFRRSVEKRRRYACNNDNACVVNVESRRRCSSCRMRKCVQLGMCHPATNEHNNHNTVNNNDFGNYHGGNYGANYAVNNGDNEGPSGRDEEECNENLGLQGSADDELNDEMPQLHLMSSSYSSEDAMMVDELIRVDHSNSFQLNEHLSKLSLDAISAFIYAIGKGTPLEFSAIFWAYTVGIKKLTRFAQSIEDFDKLQSVQDKKNLLLHNLDPMFNIRMGHFFAGSDRCNTCTLLEQLDRLAIFDVSLLHRVLSWAPHLSCLRWDQFFTTPWANSAEHEQKYEQLMACIARLELDRGSATLFSIIALFSVDDDIELQDAHAVHAIRRKYETLLFRYICHTRGTEVATAVFPLFVEMRANLRHMSDIMKNKTIKMTHNWPDLAALL